MQSLNAQNSNAQTSNVNVGDTSSPASDISISENSSKRLWRVDGNEFNISSLEYDSGLRHQIWGYDINQRGKIQRAYIKAVEVVFGILCFLLILFVDNRKVKYNT